MVRHMGERRGTRGHNGWNDQGNMSEHIDTIARLTLDHVMALHYFSRIDDLVSYQRKELDLTSYSWFLAVDLSSLHDVQGCIRRDIRRAFPDASVL